MAFIALDDIFNLYDGYRKRFRVGRHELLMCQHEGDIFLVSGLCPHQGADLGSASLYQHASGCPAIRCPRHGLAFSLRDGRGIEHNALNCASLSCYEVDYDGTKVGIFVDPA